MEKSEEAKNPTTSKPSHPHQTPIPLAFLSRPSFLFLPYRLTSAEAAKAFLDFLRFINTRLHDEKLPRLESIIMSANFSSLVGEFMNAGIPKYCKTLVKNKYHNGHPDMIPAGMFPGDSVQHAAEGIEIKASRYVRGWQGHNAEDTWLMVFVYDSNRGQRWGRQSTTVSIFGGTRCATG